ncbi:MAG: hypothetical protein J5I92_14195 [Thiogranum sp.]|nr:hypothetical protein [Thiogranum sp.]
MKNSPPGHTALTDNAFTRFLHESVAMDYSEFAPRLYNFCKQSGLRRGHWRLVSAFCPSEDQGYPLLALTKHFGCFPVDTGSPSGVMRYAAMPEDHDMDLVIVQASHVRAVDRSMVHHDGGGMARISTQRSRDCPYLHQALQWYQNEYRVARNSISLKKHDDSYVVIIANHLLDDGRKEGLFLHMDKLLRHDAEGRPLVIDRYSTTTVIAASDNLISRASAACLGEDEVRFIDRNLDADLFFFKRDTGAMPEQERNRIDALNDWMPQIITSSWPALALAKASIQIEFDRTFRILARDEKYRGRNIVYIGAFHQDAVTVSDRAITPTLVVPWAAYVRHSDGRQRVLEQPELVEHLKRSSPVNPEEIDLDAALHGITTA